MVAIVILVCHYHYRTIPQGLDGIIVFIKLEAHYLDEMFDLLVLHDLRSVRIAHV